MAEQKKEEEKASEMNWYFKAEFYGYATIFHSGYGRS